MTIKIDKTVPLPAKRAPHQLYPFDDMVVGDSFFAPGRITEQMSGSITNVYRKHPEWRMTSRTVTENGVRGTRVWRIE